MSLGPAHFIRAGCAILGLGMAVAIGSAAASPSWGLAVGVASFVAVMAIGEDQLRRVARIAELRAALDRGRAVRV